MKGNRAGRLVAWLVLAFAMASPASANNILILILDDVGIDRVAAYGAHPDPGNTPVFDALASQGVLFRNAWAHPVCSPSRAAMLTGMRPAATGVGAPVSPNTPERTAGLDPSVPTAPKALAPLGYESWALGKWHLSGGETPDPDHPRAVGFDYHAGSLFNFVNVVPEESYYNWTKTVNGVSITSFGIYATTDTVDETLARIQQAQGSWFAWVAFNAPHRPYEAPPSSLHTVDLTGATPVEYTKAMIEAIDTEVGRLLTSMDPLVLADTTIIVVGDNGTVGLATTAPFPTNHAKFTVYEGGVRVPLIVAGAAVPLANQDTESEALVHVEDLYATIIDLAGGTPPAGDSQSIVPYLVDSSAASVRSSVYSERYEPNGIAEERTLWAGAARDGRYKLLIRQLAGQYEFYDLDLDPFEAANLQGQSLGPEASAAHNALKIELDDRRTETVPEPDAQGRMLVIVAGVALLLLSRRARH